MCQILFSRLRTFVVFLVWKELTIRNLHNALKKLGLEGDGKARTDLSHVGGNVEFAYLIFWRSKMNTYIGPRWSIYRIMLVLKVQNLISYLDFRCKGTRYQNPCRHSHTQIVDMTLDKTRHHNLFAFKKSFIFNVLHRYPGDKKRCYNRPIPDTLPGLSGEDVCTLLLGGCHAGLAWTGRLRAVKIVMLELNQTKMSKNSNNILILTQPQPQPTATTPALQCRLFRSSTISVSWFGWFQK